MPDSERILGAILKSQERTDEQIGKLADSVQKLVMIDAARVERDKSQIETNKRFGKFMDDHRITLSRSKNAQATWDKVKIPLIVMVIVSVLGAAGYNLKG